MAIEALLRRSRAQRDELKIHLALLQPTIERLHRLVVPCHHYKPRGLVVDLMAGLEIVVDLVVDSAPGAHVEGLLHALRQRLASVRQLCEAREHRWFVHHNEVGIDFLNALPPILHVAGLEPLGVGEYAQDLVGRHKTVPHDALPSLGPERLVGPHGPKPNEPGRRLQRDTKRPRNDQIRRFFFRAIYFGPGPRSDLDVGVRSRRAGANAVGNAVALLRHQPALSDLELRILLADLGVQLPVRD
mmetsp:Transcript_89932/g.253649  ORF Transcript_89932/g.253649 Transcript_89932/m.253649 type:complete len:244 (+) Transcript_89932:1030-1761(+)